MLLQKPLNTSLRGLFVTGQENDEVALRLPGFALQPNEVRHEYGRACLVVVAAASVEPILLLGQRPRIDRPIHTRRGHNVQVRHQQNRAGAGIPATQSSNEIPRARIRSQDADVLSWNACGDQAVGQRLGCAWRFPVLLRGSNLDELFEYLAGQRAIRRRGAASARARLAGCRRTKPPSAKRIERNRKPLMRASPSRS